jgi:branched-chain amino acid transport system substrate-binding protein
MVAVVAFGLAASACWSSEPDRGGTPLVRIAFFQDLSIGDHIDLVSPSFLAFDRAVHDGIAGMDLDVQVVQFDTGGDPGTASTFARQVVLDPTFVLAVLAPFWEEPEDVGETLARGGVPTFSLSPESPSIWAMALGRRGVGPAPPGGPEDLWRRFVPDQGLQAVRLAAIIGDAVPETLDDSACLFAQDTTYAGELREAVEADLPVLVSTVSPATGDMGAAVDAVQAGCEVTVWIGSPEGADELTEVLQEAELDPTIDLASDAMKTVMPIPGPDGTPMVEQLTCPCRDVNLANSDAARRFINAYQSATGLAPGVYAAEAWDAGALTAQAFHGGVRDRQQMRDYVGSLDSYDGTGGPVRFDNGGELVDPQVPVFTPSGTRWIPSPAAP